MFRSISIVASGKFGKPRDLVKGREDKSGKKSPGKNVVNETGAFKRKKTAPHKPTAVNSIFNVEFGESPKHYVNSAPRQRVLSRSQ